MRSGSVYLSQLVILDNKKKLVCVQVLGHKKKYPVVSGAPYNKYGSRKQKIFSKPQINNIEIKS
jgi:hypothetical protein